MIRSCYEMMGIIIITTIILGAIGVAAILSYRLYRLCRQPINTMAGIFFFLPYRILNLTY